MPARLRARAAAGGAGFRLTFPSRYNNLPDPKKRRTREDLAALGCVCAALGRMAPRQNCTRISQADPGTLERCAAIRGEDGRGLSLSRRTTQSLAIRRIDVVGEQIRTVQRTRQVRCSRSHSHRRTRPVLPWTTTASCLCVPSVRYTVPELPCPSGPMLSVSPLPNFIGS